MVVEDLELRYGHHAWQLAREAHAVDFGCFALLEAELEAEMRRRKLGIGSTGGVLDVEEQGDDKQKDSMFEFIWTSYWRWRRWYDRYSDSVTPGPKPTPAPRTDPNLPANAYWTSQRAAEAEGYIQDLV